VDQEGFVRGVSRVIGDVNLSAFKLSKVRLGEVLTEVLSLSRKHRVYLEPVFANMVISIIVLEGIGRQLCPDVDLFKELVPFLPRMHRDYISGMRKLL
jgi:aarF domain-containing kinase